MEGSWLRPATADFAGAWAPGNGQARASPARSCKQRYLDKGKMTFSQPIDDADMEDHPRYGSPDRLLRDLR